MESFGNGLKRPANGEGTASPATADDLKRLEADLKGELETALASADASAIVDLRGRLALLPVRITAAEITAAKERLEGIEREIEIQQSNVDLINAVKLQRKIELDEKFDELEACKERYARCGFEVSLANNLIETLREERREKRQRLVSLTEQLKN